MTSKERGQKFHTDDVSLPTSGSASDWLKQILENFPRQSTNQRHYSDLCGEAVCVVTCRMEFLHSFLRRHFLEVASRNVGCFLRPLSVVKFEIMGNKLFRSAV